ncbi:MAG: DNA gyrase subunit A [Burkholderiales bacterium]|nr:DNA gyrase subunit A [Anaerolineae bacterium]
MRGSYLDYAMSVIVARALPDARDGMKPVHRRILYAMYDLGIRANTSYKKSARIVGEVLGKYHPHGDTAVYDAMARMAQDFSLRYPLVDGQGNFGSIDGDSPAAMRYTEARLAHTAEEMLSDIHMNTVDFVDTYDGSQQEPAVLPARLPNLLLNGASGIAVGMATNIPPHNMGELARAITYLIDNYNTMDDISVDDLMQFVHGPDFPTGALIVAGDELKEAYATGRGRVAMRARAKVEEMPGGERHRIVVTEIPYQVSKTLIIERIVAMVREGRLEHVADLRDESDRDGLRIVLELKRGAQPLTVLNRLYKYTQLQSTYSIQMLALVNGEPRTLSLKRALQIFIEHRYDVIVRRSQFELGKAQARAHILIGLLTALSNLDAVIQTIRAAQDTEEARTSLVERFALSEAQANAILEMQLRRLAALERQKLQDEHDEVMARIAYLEDLLASPEKILALIRDDVNTMADSYSDVRRTEILYGVSVNFNEADLVREEEVVISLTSRGYIKRVPSSAYRAQHRGGKGVIGMATKEEDVLTEILAASSLDYILFFTDKGRVYGEMAYRIPETGRANQGTLINAVLSLQYDEHITAIQSIDTFDVEQGYFVMSTVHGRIKRVHLDQFASVRPSGLIAMSLEPGDTLGWVQHTTGDQDVLLVTEAGQSIRFAEHRVRVMGRQAGGVNAIRLTDGDLVAGMDIVKPDDTHVLVVTREGFGKRTPIDEYGAQGRYGLGVRTLARNEKTGPIVAMRCMSAADDILVITRDGVVLRTRLDQIRQTGRNTQGVIVMHLAKGDAVIGLAIMDAAPIEGLPTDEAAVNGAEADSPILDGASLEEILIASAGLDEDIELDDTDSLGDRVVGSNGNGRSASDEADDEFDGYDGGDDSDNGADGYADFDEE